MINIVYVKQLVFECKSHFNFAQTYISTCRLTPQWQQAWLEMKLCLPPVGYQPVAKSKLVGTTLRFLPINYPKTMKNKVKWPPRNQVICHNKKPKNVGLGGHKLWKVRTNILQNRHIQTPKITLTKSSIRVSLHPLCSTSFVFFWNRSTRKVPKTPPPPQQRCAFALGLVAVAPRPVGGMWLFAPKRQRKGSDVFFGGGRVQFPYQTIYHPWKMVYLPTWMVDFWCWM